MRKRETFQPAALVIAMALSATATAATAPEQSPAKAIAFNWSAKTGLGYDSNAYRAPSSSYTDLAPAVPVPVNPTTKSGVFVPFEIKIDAETNSGKNNRLIGSAALDGSLYLGSGLGNASEYNIDFAGGIEHVLKREGKSEDTLYFGGLIGKHKQVYVDHDTGQSKTTAGLIDISGRYSYFSVGAEAEYKHRIGKFDYGFNGKLMINDYEDPIVVSQEDHTYFTLGADASVPLASQTRMNFSFDHKIRDYSKRHSRDAQGRLANANPLLTYTYDKLGVTVRNRFSEQWLVYGDLDLTQRADNNVGYNDYSQNRIGGRVLFEQGNIKGRLALHHWSRDYPNGFAFDRPVGGSKTYSGNDLKITAELAQSKNTAYWAELVYDSQTATDLRYDYVRTLVMAGMSWAY